MRRLWAKILFILKYKTLKRVSLCGDSSSELAVYHRGKEVKIKRQCPHQGLPLDKGYFQGDDFVCPWHGCRLSLVSAGVTRPFVPTLHSHKKS